MGTEGQAQATNQKTCKVITNFLPYEGWLAVAKELVYFGEFVKARSLLQEAKRHAAYLTNNEYLFLT